MTGGSLSDQKIQEFDAYLSGSDMPGDFGNKSKTEEKVSSVVDTGDIDLDKIVELHEKKVDLILSLLYKIDAKSHKDIVADLVDEMQYERSVIKREKDQASDLKKLVELANEAAKK